MSQYVKTYVERDIGRLFPGLDQDRFRLFLQHLAGLSGTVINHSDVARGLGVSPPTARDYFEIAHGTFLWRGLDCGAFFYRTSAGAEIDLVLEGDVGLVPIEIKYASSIDRRRLAALQEFVAERRCRYGLAITNDSQPRLLDEAIVAVPFLHL